MEEAQGKALPDGVEPGESSELAYDKTYRYSPRPDSRGLR